MPVPWDRRYAQERREETRCVRALHYARRGRGAAPTPLWSLYINIGQRPKQLKDKSTKLDISGGSDLPFEPNSGPSSPAQDDLPPLDKRTPVGPPPGQRPPGQVPFEPNFPATDPANRPWTNELPAHRRHRPAALTECGSQVQNKYFSPFLSSRYPNSTPSLLNPDSPPHLGHSAHEMHPFGNYCVDGGAARPSMRTNCH